jgi:integration host factor subunit alpha
MMTKADLTEKIRDKLGIKLNESVELVESVLEIMKCTLEAGEDIKISCFGSFKILKKSERNGRNPVTGDGLIVDGRKVVTFKASPVLKDYINS